MFRLDEDLSRFYELVRDDELSWCALGAGRMLRAPTVFEDVVKTKLTFIRIFERRAGRRLKGARLERGFRNARRMLNLE